MSRRSWQVTRRLWGDRRLRALLWVQWLPPACLTGAEALVVPYVGQRGYPRGAAGLLLGCVPAGMLLGNLVVGRLLRPATRERLVAVLLLVLGAPVVLAAVPLPLPVVAVLLALAGAGCAYALGVQRAFVDALDPALRGQGFALQSTGLMTLQGVGPVLAGALAQATNPALAVGLCGAGAVLVAGWWTTAGGTRRGSGTRRQSGTGERSGTRRGPGTGGRSGTGRGSGTRRGSAVAAGGPDLG